MPDWTPTIDLVIRPSSLPGWRDCARRTAARLFPGIIGQAGYKLRSLTPSVGAAVGTAVHAGAAELMDTKLKTGSSPKLPPALDRAIDAFETSIKDGAIWDAVTPNQGSAKAQVHTMVTIYNKHVAPVIQPIAVEERLSARVTSNITISGQKDIGVEGGIQDLKTGKRQSANGAQYGAYSLLDRTHGKPVNWIREDFIRRLPAGQEAVPVKASYDPAVCEQEAREVIDDIQSRITVFLSRVKFGAEPPEAVFPANPMSVLCGARYCPAHGTSFCRLHQGATST